MARMPLLTAIPQQLMALEQRYSGIEGDSASCTELFALLSSLATVPIRQGIAVTGAFNQHGTLTDWLHRQEGFCRPLSPLTLAAKIPPPQKRRGSAEPRQVYQVTTFF